LERKFEIVLITENSRWALESSAKESQHPDLPTAPSFVEIGAVFRKIRRIGDVPCEPPRHGRKIRNILKTITPSTYEGSGVGVEG
jgi:hypothetical protein